MFTYWLSTFYISKFSIGWKPAAKNPNLDQDQIIPGKEPSYRACWINTTTLNVWLQQFGVCTCCFKVRLTLHTLPILQSFDQQHILMLSPFVLPSMNHNMSLTINVYTEFCAPLLWRRCIFDLSDRSYIHCYQFILCLFASYHNATQNSTLLV